MAFNQSVQPLTNSWIRYFIAFTLLFIPLSDSFSQIVDGNGYLIGDFVEIGVHGNGGYEGTANLAGSHARGGGYPEAFFGFVAAQGLSWTDYNGDYFTSGSPENGFGLEIGGVNYSNNAWNDVDIEPHLQEIPTASPLSYSVDDGCLILNWEGVVAGVRINVRYHLISFSTEKYYTTEITLTNTTGSNLTDVYYYRNIDPDNNESLGGTFNTTNTIVSQPNPDCIKALVSAEQSTPWASYIGLGALGSNFRVSHGGFSNRSGSDIWNATGGLTGTVGDVATGDEAISLAYKTDLAAGETVDFSYTVVLSEGAVEAALASLYSIHYTTMFGTGGGLTDACSPEATVINTCKGGDLTLWVEGPDVDEYDWAWSGDDDGAHLGDTVTITTNEAGTFGMSGTPISECLTEIIAKVYTINFTEGPMMNFEDPGLICGSIAVEDLVYYDFAGLSTDCILLSEEPDSANQIAPEFMGDTIYPGDNVWVLCKDSATGCWDDVPLFVDFLTGAGPDTTAYYCNQTGLVINLYNIIPDSITRSGMFFEIPDEGNLDTLGNFFASGLLGEFTFEYVVEGLPPECPPDTAIYTIILEDGPIARLGVAVNGDSISSGAVITCIHNEIDLYDLSFINPPGEITSWDWDFGNGDTSDLPDPDPFLYEEPGLYAVELAVGSENECTHRFQRIIQIYETIPIDTIKVPPTCYGSEDGSIEVEVLITDDFTIEIRDSADVIRNEDGGLIADSLSAGTYSIYVADESGCDFSGNISLEEPPFMYIWLTVVNPPCLGDSGYVVVDSVAGESLNNPVSYEWDPNPAGIEGFDADSSYWMKAGDYTVTATDSRGCTNSVDITLVDPPLFYFTEWGWDTAYCRLHPFQSGNGVVYAAAAGGVPNYDYKWTYLEDGTMGFNSTWGGRNPGDHLIEITDAWGCVLTKIIHVDSVNPIAAFETTSLDLNENCEGTAPVEVKFTNKSRYYANPNNPAADTTFFWDMDRTDVDDWIITHDFYFEPDTIYEARGESYQVDVCLIAFNKNGCSDTACKKITIWEPPELSTVNIFTPDGSGVNDVFTFVNYQKGIRDFQCIIVNRWGVQVGEINTIESGWDGTNMNNGEMCVNGVYFYSYTATADNGEEFAGQGTVTLINQREE